jgi:hypothetical protein
MDRSCPKSAGPTALEIRDGKVDCLIDMFECGWRTRELVVLHSGHVGRSRDGLLDHERIGGALASRHTPEVLQKNVDEPGAGKGGIIPAGEVEIVALSLITRWMAVGSQDRRRVEDFPRALVDTGQNPVGCFAIAIKE